jgi:replicative DNA helicase
MHLAPHDQIAEQALVGSVLIDPSIFSQLSELIKRDDIYNVGLQEVWGAFERLDSKGEPIDQVTVYEESKAYPGIANIITETMTSTPYAGNPQAYAKIVADNAVYRRLIEAARKIAELGYSSPDSTESALDRAESILFSASRSQRSGRFWTAPEMVGRAYDRIARIAAGESRAGVPTGIASIDRVTGGWQKSDLIIIAARPSVGKTALATTMAMNAAAVGKKIAIFSIEMSSEQIGARMLSSSSGVPLQNIRQGVQNGMDLARIAAGVYEIDRADINVDDTPSATPGELRSKCRRLLADKGVDLIIVDYLQLMSPDRVSKDGNRVSDVSDISRGLKMLARELNVPVIALSQLSRSSEYRESGEPRLSDLRDSGAIEQDADVVLMLWKKGDVAFDDIDETVYAKIAKHRNGPTGLAELQFHRPTAKFSEVR